MKIRRGSLWNNFPELNTLQLSPRQAFFAATETLPIKEAINRISAETVCPYPPGIPLLIPGEIITSAIVEHLLNVKAMGGFISNCADTSLCTLKVARDGHWALVRKRVEMVTRGWGEIN